MKTAELPRKYQSIAQAFVAPFASSESEMIGAVPVDPEEPSTRRLIFLGLFVADIEKSARFYKDAFGLDLAIGENPGGDPWVGGMHAETSWREGAYLHFALLPAAGQPSRAHITLTVDDLKKAHEQAIAAAAEVLHEPRQEAWGKAGRYLDLDGNIVTLMQQ